MFPFTEEIEVKIASIHATNTTIIYVKSIEDWFPIFFL